MSAAYWGYSLIIIIIILTIIYIYIYGLEESGFICRGHGARVCVILVLREYIWNVPAVSFVLPAFDDTGSLGFSPRPVVCSLGSTLGDCLPIPCGGIGGEQKMYVRTYIYGVGGVWIQL